MAAHHCINAQSFGQKASPVIKQSNNRFCISCQFGQHCGSCVCCKSHHAPLSDGIYRFNGEYVAILDCTEVAWSDNYREISRSFDEMVMAEFEVAA